MKKTVKRLITACLTLSILLMLCACGAGSASDTATTAGASGDLTTSSAEPTTITIGLVGEPDTLCPYMFTADKDSLVQSQMFPAMFVNDESGNPVPHMIESYEFDEDSLTYTWHLTQGAKWSDGEDVTIDDVLFTINSVAGADYTGGNSTGVTGILGYEDYHNGNADTLAGVQKVDDYTCTIQLSEWDPCFLGYYCDPGSILPEHVLSSVPVTEWTKSDFAENPISYGPYKLAAWEHGEYIELVKNETYYGTPASIDTVIFRFAEEATTFVNAYMNGEIDMFKAPFEDLDTLKALDGTNAYTCTPANYPLYPNLIKGPLSELAVRQAIMYSYDSDAIAKTVFGEYGEGSKSVFCNSNWAVDPDAVRYTEDHEKAKQLLEDAGYTMGSDGYYTKDGQTLEFTSLCTGGEMEDVLTLWQASLKKSGIKANIKVVDWSVMVETISDQETADYGTYTFGGGDGDPSGLMVLYCSAYDAAVGGFNFNKCGDETLDALWFAGRQETDHEARTAIYHQIDDYMTENALLFPMCEKSTVWIASARVGNVVLNNLNNLLNLATFTIQ